MTRIPGSTACLFVPGAVALALAGLTASLAAQAPGVERFGGRLSRMPVDLVTTSTIRGEGAVAAGLRERELTLKAEFQGLSSPVTAVHVHNAPRARPGEVAFPIDLGEPLEIAGEFMATVTLTDAQAAELRAGRYYLQIHTETNPGGELRGWLLPAGD
ncbi:MAG: CHRD domain-containing protein [Acidobacteria bacterium]|nr:CHRD domain-containing protein [Acidobacteriota bacterium]